MKNVLPLLTVLGFSSFAQADIIRCSFTEPFVNTVYSMTQQSLTITTPEAKPRVVKNVSFQIRGPANFEIVDKKGKVLQQLVLNNQGSDGMSDRVYPYEVKDFNKENGANQGIGGCWSNYLRTAGEG